jgi:tetratricopeptide (TPR) repeat protein
VDANYFYADFLYQQERYAQALEYLQKALAAPADPDRPVADAGRREEIRALMAKVKENLH